MAPGLLNCLHIGGKVCHRRTSSEFRRVARCGLLRKTLILLSLLTCGSAVAQSDPPADAAPAPAPTAAEKKAEEKKEDAPINARLAPGGVVAGGSTFPLGIQLTIDNSLGNGIFAPGLQQQVFFGSSVNVRPSARLPATDFTPRMILLGSIDFSVLNWLPEFSNFTAYDRQIWVGDALAGVILPGIFKEEFTGIGMSLIFSGRAPLSLLSRQQNLLTNLGGAAQFMWGSPETPVGSFFVQYTPSARFSLYTQPGATMPCSTPTSPTRAGTGADPIDGLADLPNVYGRDEQLLPDGECVLPGRQIIATVGNNLATGWSTADGAHNVTVTAGWSFNFLRPLKNEPDFASPFASGQNFNEGSSGSLSYTYTVPVDYRFFITAGVFSQQLSAYNAQGQLLFPIYDFVTPANNYSSFFVDLTFGI